VSPGQGLRGPFLGARKRLKAAEGRIADLEAQVERLRGMVLDLGGDPDP
jgi:hypothetical protein